MISMYKNKKYSRKNLLRATATLALPVFIQNLVTQSVVLADNVMMGQLGTEALSGVSVANTLNFMYILIVFGLVSGAGIFGAQYFGKGDFVNMRHTFRFRIISCLCAALIVMGILAVWGTDLLKLFMSREKAADLDMDLALKYGSQYLFFILFSMPAFAITQCYSSIMREAGKPLLPMIAALAGVITDIIFNALLIFGLLGFPELGAVGAGIATIIARVIELLVLVAAVRLRIERYPFIKGAYAAIFNIPKQLSKRIVKQGFPLAVNEFLWSFSVTMLLWAYSSRGLSVLAAFTISNVLENLLNVSQMALCVAIGTLVGQKMGAGKLEEAKWAAGFLTIAGTIVSIAIALLMLSLAPIFPRFYKTTEDIRALAAAFLMIAALKAPLNAYVSFIYFIMRAGGKTWVTFFFDCFYEWAFSVPLALIIANFTQWPPVVMVFMVQIIPVAIKCVIGNILLRQGKWLNNLA